MSAASIPQANPLANCRANASEIDAAVRRVLESGVYLSGSETAAFEAEFARFIGVSHGVGASSGTDALWLALAGCGIGLGDEVITVSHTAVATAAAIDLSGATPIFVDVNPRTYTLDPRQLEQAKTSRTRAVLPVHLYGQPADLAPMVDFCRRHDLLLIEDCAQAAGAFCGGRRVGSIADAGVFSFYPTKNLSALGDAGMVVTNSSFLAAEMRALREYGWRDKERLSERTGRNARMDEMQAAILRVKLPHLDRDNERRRQLARDYSEALASIDEITLPAEGEMSASVFHQYVIRSQQRDALSSALRADGIATAIHYPIPIHAQPAYRGRGLVRNTGRGSEQSLPETERAAAEVLSLPMFPELSAAQIESVTAAIREFFHR